MADRNGMKLYFECQSEDFCPRLTVSVKEIWFALSTKNHFSSVGFEPTTSGVDHQRSNRLVNRELVVGIKVFSRGNGEIQLLQTV